MLMETEIPNMKIGSFHLLLTVRQFKILFQLLEKGKENEKKF